MSGRGTSATAGVLFGLAAAEVTVVVVVGAVSDVGAPGLVNGFAVSNAVLGLSLAVAGWPIAGRRPGNPIGWSMLAAGIGYVTSAAGYAVLAAGAQAGGQDPGWRLLATVTNIAWTWAVTLLLPVTLLLFPDGHLLGRRWRWLVLTAAVNAVLLAAMAVVPEQTLSSQLGVRGYLTVPGARQLGWVAAVNVVAGLLVYVGCLVALVLRFRRGDELVRQQLLWLVLAVVIIVGCSAVSDILRINSWLAIFSIALLPLAIMISILRYQLLDIRLVVSRSVLYLLLTVLVTAAYAGLVALLDTLLRVETGQRRSIIATLAIALAFHPARRWLQGRIEWIFYGARGDPVRAVAEVGARLGNVPDGSTGLEGVLDALCHVMRLPAASILVDGVVIASCGSQTTAQQKVPLRQGSRTVGELLVGLRAGQNRLDLADTRLLELLSDSLAVAVRATALTEDLHKAREAVVVAREEERRRLRRDLHDGLGPALTGVGLKAHAARRLSLSDPSQSVTLLTELGAEVAAAINDIRRLVNGLRPPALDELGGLVAALRDQAEILSHHPDGTSLKVYVDAEALPAVLPAATEVAVYRIATEALTNISRHSTASAARVSLIADGSALTVLISDNGTDFSDWRAGVGLTSMRERARELGGACQAGPSSHGGRVSVSIPLRDVP